MRINSPALGGERRRRRLKQLGRCVLLRQRRRKGNFLQNLFRSSLLSRKRHLLCSETRWGRSWRNLTERRRHWWSRWNLIRCTGRREKLAHSGLHAQLNQWEGWQRRRWRSRDEIRQNRHLPLDRSVSRYAAQEHQGPHVQVCREQIEST